MLNDLIARAELEEILDHLPEISYSEEGGRPDPKFVLCDVVYTTTVSTGLTRIAV